MKLIKAATDFPSQYELEINSDEELEIIKEALDSYHEHLLMTNKNNSEDFDENNCFTVLTMKVEEMCQELGIPGYEWS